ncbi:MAG: MFS transporter, partial [Halolamina sp.]|uniref:MFS transporter n=1 Tax=Halolamina sp. TaxID=1940283 RepID=UPI002FC3C591
MQLRRLGRYDALILTSLIWFMAKFLRYAFPPLFGTFQELYGVSNATIGAAFSALMVAYALMQFPSGVLADRRGPVPIITAGAVVTGIGALVLLVAEPFPLLVGGMLLVGLGTGAHKTVAVRLLTMVHPSRTGRALGTLDTIAAFGGVAAPAAVVYALPDWRGLFLAGGLVVLTLAALFAIRTPRRLPKDGGVTAQKDDDGVALAAYARSLSQPRVALFVAVTVAVSFGYNGAVAFLPLYLTDAAGLSTAAASALYSGLFVVSLVQLGTGELADRAGRIPVLLATVGAAAIGVALLQVVAGALAVGAAVILFGIGGHGYRPARSAFLMSILPDEAAGGGLGVVRTVLMSSAAVAPAVTGYLIDARSFAFAFAALAASLALAFVLLVVVAITGEAGE